MLQTKPCPATVKDLQHGVVKTVDDQPFVVHDSGSGRARRFIVFGRRETVAALAAFSTRQFFQL